MCSSCPVLCCESECRPCLPAAVGFLAVSSVITMSAPFFLGRIIDVIYTNPSEDYGDSLTRLCAALTCVFLCGAAANSIRVYLMQSSGQSPQVTKDLGSGQGSKCRYSRPLLVLLSHWVLTSHQEGIQSFRTFSTSCGQD